MDPIKLKNALTIMSTLDMCDSKHVGDQQAYRKAVGIIVISRHPPQPHNPPSNSRRLDAVMRLLGTGIPVDPSAGDQYYERAGAPVLSQFESIMNAFPSDDLVLVPETALNSSTTEVLNAYLEEARASPTMCVINLTNVPYCPLPGQPNHIVLFRLFLKYPGGFGYRRLRAMTIVMVEGEPDEELKAQGKYYLDFFKGNYGSMGPSALCRTPPGSSTSPIGKHFGAQARPANPPPTNNFTS